MQSSDSLRETSYHSFQAVLRQSQAWRPVRYAEFDHFKVPLNFRHSHDGDLDTFVLENTFVQNTKLEAQYVCLDDRYPMSVETKA